MLTKNILHAVMMNCAARTTGIGCAWLTDTMPDLHGESFGATYEDYLAGNFYSQDWQAGGAAPGAIKGRFPALFIERDEAVHDGYGNVKTKYHFIVVANKACQTDGRNGYTDARGTAEDLLAAYLTNLREYVRATDVNEQTIWLFPGDDATAKPTPGGMFAYMPAAYTITSWGNLPDLRGAIATITITTCDKRTAQLRPIDIYERRGVVRCDVC